MLRPQIGIYGKERAVGTYLNYTRYDKVVEALGGHGEYCERPEQIRPALERAFASGKPALRQRGDPARRDRAEGQHVRLAATSSRTRPGGRRVRDAPPEGHPIANAVVPRARATRRGGHVRGRAHRRAACAARAACSRRASRSRRSSVSRRCGARCARRALDAAARGVRAARRRARSLLGLVRLENRSDEPLALEYTETWDVPAGEYRVASAACERRFGGHVFALAEASAVTRARRARGGARARARARRHASRCRRARGATSRSPTSRCRRRRTRASSCAPGAARRRRSSSASAARPRAWRPTARSAATLAAR